MTTTTTRNTPEEVLTYIDTLRCSGKRHVSSREVHDAFKLYMALHRNYTQANIPGYYRLKTYDDIVDDFCGTVSIMTVTQWMKENFEETAALMRVRHRREPVWSKAEIFGAGN